MEVRIYKRIYENMEFTEYAILKIRRKVRIEPIFFKENPERLIFEISKTIKDYILPKYNFDFPLILVIPPKKYTSFEKDDEEYILDSESAFIKDFRNLVENKDVFVENGELKIDKNTTLINILKFLKEKGRVAIIGEGKLRRESILPVNRHLGFLSKVAWKYSLSFNSHFFVFELLELKSHYSKIGDPFGLLVENNFVHIPPLYNRSAIVINENETYIKNFNLCDFEIILNGERYMCNKNAVIFTKKEFEYTPREKNAIDFVIVKRKLLGYKLNGNTLIPDSGFVLRVRKVKELPKKTSFVKFIPLKYIDFSIQIGPALIKDSKIMNELEKNFYSEEISYPPTKFPFDWNKTSAARIGIGVDNDKNLILITVEGSNRDNTYIKGVDSKGFTLEELAEIFKKEKTYQALNLDGGGSMEVFLNSGKLFKSGDRRGIPFLEHERPIPVALGII